MKPFPSPRSLGCLIFFSIALFLAFPSQGRGEDSGKTDLLKKASLSDERGLPVLRLEGNPYEVGYQHGELLKERVQKGNKRILSYFAKKLKVPILGRMVVHVILDRSYRKMEPFIPDSYKEEMRGLADGSGVSLKNIHRVHAIPDLYSTLCSSGAFFGKATDRGRLYHLRNLDWNREIGIQNYGAVILYELEGHLKFVNIGYIGFIGTLSGMNEKGISIGQIGSESKDETLKGFPMPFLLRKVLEEAGGLDQAIAIMRDHPRTIGCNYVFANALKKQACAIETSAHRFQVFFDNDLREKVSPYSIQLEDTVFRGDMAFDPAVRDVQTSAGGDPDRPGFEDPKGSSSYEVRYLGQAHFAKQQYGHINEIHMFALARTVAPKSNVQSVIYSFPDFWVANAEDEKKAAESGYLHFNFENLFQ